MNLILLILGRLYNINISSYTKTIQIIQYYYAINRASRRRPPRAVIVTPRTFRPCSLHVPRINTSHSTSQENFQNFQKPRIFALRSLHTPIFSDHFYLSHCYTIAWDRLSNQFFLSVYVCMYVCMYICMYVCICGHDYGRIFQPIFTKLGKNLWGLNRKN